MDAQLVASDSSLNQNLVFRPKVKKLVAQRKLSFQVNTKPMMWMVLII